MDYTPAWISKLQVMLSVPLRLCIHLIGVQWGFGARQWPDPLNLRVWGPSSEPPSLYMNGIVYASLRLPFFVNFMLRWSPNHFLQVHVGWRPVDGAPVAVFRIQTDDSAQGGLALGFQDGGK